MRAIRTTRSILALALILVCATVVSTPVRADFVLGQAQNYAVLYEGTGGHNLSITNVTVNGNIGVGGTGVVQFGGPGTINGILDFSAANSGQFHNSNVSNVGPTSVHYNVTNVPSALSTINSLSTTSNSNAAGAPTVNLTSGATINITSGHLVGGTYYFNVGSVNLSGSPVTINGSAGQSVVFNDTSNLNINGGISLSGGLTSDEVLFNVVGGKSLQTSTNGAPVSGIFLDPLGTIQITHTTVNGRVFGGDSSDMQIVSGDTINGPQGTNPQVTTPEPPAIALFALGMSGLLAVSAVARKVSVITVA
jgi:hypothetical protein